MERVIFILSNFIKMHIFRQQFSNTFREICPRSILGMGPVIFYHRKMVHSAFNSSRFRHISAMTETNDGGKDQPPNMEKRS